MFDANVKNKSDAYVEEGEPWYNDDRFEKWRTGGRGEYLTKARHDYTFLAVKKLLRVARLPRFRRIGWTPV